VKPDTDAPEGTPRWLAPAAWVTRLPPRAVFAFGVAIVALLGVTDYATGREVSFSIFYLAPVALVTWRAGRTPGVAVSVIAAAVWGGVDLAGGSRYSSPLIPVWNSLVRLGSFIITLWLIDAVHRAHGVERNLARTDPLTGVANGRAFHELLDRELSRVRRTGSPLTVAYLDLDRFKAVNDALGHEAGDRLLREVASRIARSLRAQDLVARLGGDEFVLLLPDTEASAARAALDRSLGVVREAVSACPGAPAGVGATIGAVVFTQAPASSDAAIRAADDRMYEGKRAGRDRLLLETWPSRNEADPAVEEAARGRRE
jgi:diguanylate cyclase (GGDEF)-like protein